MSEAKVPLHVTMVKKRLLGGEPCKKCIQAEEMLRRRELWEQVDAVLWADEGDEGSPGMQLSRKYQIETAPFFLVKQGDETALYPSAIKVAKEVLAPKRDAQAVSAREVLARPFGEEELRKEAERLEGRSPQEVLSFALEKFSSRCAIAFSGAEDVVLIDMAIQSGFEFSVFCLDTGRLHPETYRFLDTVRQFYGIEIRLFSPNFVPLEKLVRKKGLFSFYEEGHGECCSIRKLEPLGRALGDYDAWVTGQRRDQSPTRSDVPLVNWDHAHKSGGMLKLNPLAAMTQTEIWQYIRDHDVPYNDLHDRGYISIGCEPCTRASRPGEHERAGRWWWEESTQRECGLHSR